MVDNAFALTYPCERPPGFMLRLRARWVWKLNGRGAGAAAMMRQGFPIISFVGHNGSGKTLAAVYDLLPTLAGIPWECDNPDHPHTAEGITSGMRTVLSTVRLLDPVTGEDSGNFRLLTSYGQMLDEAYHADLLLDEVQGVADAQDHQALPAPVRNVSQKLRARDATLRWTTPDFGNANKRLRTITQGVVHCTGNYKVRQDGLQWRSARHFRWALFDAKVFDEFNNSKARTIPPEAVQHFWRPGHLVNLVYDTRASVVSLGIAVDGGSSCVGCGGSRARPKCSCPPDPEALPPGVIEETDDKGVRRRRVELRPLGIEGWVTRPGRVGEEVGATS